jgi:PPOX class probable F420-dependent enzyme
MAAEIPPAFRSLADKKAFAHLATVMSDGSPQVSPVWFDLDGRYIRINSAKGRVKDKNMRHNPHVALSIIDPDDPYRHLAVRGKVIEITERGADAHIDLLAKKYLGVDRYPYRTADEVRVIYKVEPLHIATMG